MKTEIMEGLFFLDASSFPNECNVCYKLPRLCPFILLRVALKMKMSTEQCWNDTERWTPKYLVENVSECHLFHHKSYLKCPYLNLEQCGNRPVTTCLSHGMNFQYWNSSKLYIKIQFYFRQNKFHFHYKVQLVNATEGNNCEFCSETIETYKYTMWTKFRALKCCNEAIHSYNQPLNSSYNWLSANSLQGSRDDIHFQLPVLLKLIHLFPNVL